jgi:predicted aspartyl protease
VDALIDTGATFTVVPRDLATQLQLPVTGRSEVETATSDIIMERARALVQIDGRSEINPVYISETLEQVLVGVIALETLSLTVDPTRGQLKEANSLMLFSQLGGPP